MLVFINVQKLSVATFRVSVVTFARSMAGAVDFLAPVQKGALEGA